MTCMINYSVRCFYWGGDNEGSVVCQVAFKLRFASGLHFNEKSGFFKHLMFGDICGQGFYCY